VSSLGFVIKTACTVLDYRSPFGCHDAAALDSLGKDDSALHGVPNSELELVNPNDVSNCVADSDWAQSVAPECA
jgi:hypothetical protein